MFATFYHKELSEIKDLQKKLVIVYDLYIDKNSSLDNVLANLLEGAIIYYKSRNEEEQITWIQSLFSELRTAKRGIHPYTLERVTTHRNELCYITCYKIIQNLNDKWTQQSGHLTGIIDEARSLLKQVVLGALQLNSITVDEIKSAVTQKEKSVLWAKILSLQNGLQQLIRNLIFMVSIFDIYILFDDISQVFNNVE